MRRAPPLCRQVGFVLLVGAQGMISFLCRRSTPRSATAASFVVGLAPGSCVFSGSGSRIASNNPPFLGYAAWALPSSSSTYRTSSHPERKLFSSRSLPEDSDDCDDELPPDFSRRSDALKAIAAVRKACLVTAKLQPLHGPDTDSKDDDDADDDAARKQGDGRGITTVSKKDLSPVTVGDFAAQAIVLDSLRRAFPGDAFVAEESSAALRDDPDLSEQILNAVMGVGAAGGGGIRDTAGLMRSIDYGQTYRSDGSLRRGGGAAATSKRVWCLDPIDGTKGFLRGKRAGGQYCVALALIEDGIPTIGVLGCPNLPWSVGDHTYAWRDDEKDKDNSATRGCIFVASKGSGCYQLPLHPRSGTSKGGCHRVSVTSSATIEPQDARFCLGVEKGFSDPLGQMNEIAKVMHGPDAVDDDGEIRKSVRIDSQCKYGILARGGAEIFLRLPKPDYVDWIWDVAAGSIILAEAGGLLTDVEGRPVDFSLGAKLSSNVKGLIGSSGGVIHKALVDAYGQQKRDRKLTNSSRKAPNE